MNNHIDVSDNKPDDHPQPGPIVGIWVNNTEFHIHRGHQTVVAIKVAAGIPLADELSEVFEGRPPVLLADDGAITIKGGERFISSPRTGQSS
jgi:hypothetical protein